MLTVQHRGERRTKDNTTQSELTIKIALPQQLLSRNRNLWAPMNQTNSSMFWVLLYLQFFEISVSGSDRQGANSVFCLLEPHSELLAPPHQLWQDRIPSSQPAHTHTHLRLGSPFPPGCRPDPKNLHLNCCYRLTDHIDNVNLTNTDKETDWW